MTRLELVQKVKSRKETLGITIENLAKLSQNGIRTVNRFLSGEDVRLSTVESITKVLGLDFAGNKTITCFRGLWVGRIVLGERHSIPFKGFSIPASLV